MVTLIDLHYPEISFIDNPATTRPEWTLEEAKRLMAEFGAKSLIVTDEKKTVVGILTKRDWFYENGERKLQTF